MAEQKKPLKAVPAKKEKTMAKRAESKNSAIEKRSAPVTQEVLRSDAIVLHPLVSEKAVGMIESQNKLHFIVKLNSNKSEIKKAVEALYGVKVVKVRTVRDMKGRKKALVQLDPKFKAQEIATRIGVL